MGREDNIEIFKNTMKLCEENAVLKEAIRISNLNQRIYLETNQPPDAAENQYEVLAKIVVSKKRTLDAAKAYAGKNICVLNFASASNPGGGVIRGSSAQEEAICRCSTLYKNLKEENVWEKFYMPHRRQKNPLHNDDCIYTPNVVVFKSDTAYPEILPEEKWYKVNVVTCAAPNLRERPGDRNIAVKMKRTELQKLHEKRIREVLRIAADMGNEVVILGAFGCGVFSNPPETVAEAMKTVVREYRYQFETIEFAVYCSPGDDSNYRIFQSVLGKL